MLRYCKRYHQNGRVFNKIQCVTSNKSMLLVRPSCLLLALLAVAFAADDMEDSGSTTITEIKSVNEEEIMIFRAFLIFFGVCLAFLSAIMGLLQTFQYCWMAKYKEKGQVVTASVHDLSPMAKKKHQQSIHATIDYRFARAALAPPDCYGTTIRKQVKCSEEDLIRKETNIVNCKAAPSEDCCLFTFEDGTFSFDEAIFQTPEKLSIKVVYLPDYPHSAMPISHVAPSRLRLITAVPFVATLILLSTGCMHLGLRNNPFVALAVAMGSFIVFGLLLFRCLWDAMEEEYTSNDNRLDAFTLGTFSTMASESRDVQDSV